MSNRLIVSALAAAALAAGAASSASASHPTVIRLELPGTKSTYVDLGRKGYTPGDYFLATGRVVDAATGEPAGKLGGVWTILGPTADHASFDLGLGRGTIFVTGQIHHDSLRSTLAVTGGTGPYASKRGTATFRYLGETRAALDVRLR